MLYYMDTRFFHHHRFPGLPVLAVSALAALLLAACTPEEIVYSPANESNTGLRTITLSASCEASATKAAIADDLSFNWSVGDSIAVWAVGETGGAFYNSAPYVSGNQFSVSLAGTRSGYAVYPALAADGVHASETDLYVTLPASYDLSEVSDADWSPLPMIALNQEGEDLHFKHVGGLLRLTVGDMTAATTKIEVDLGHRITGSFQVADAANPGGATCVITTDDDASGQTYVTFTGFTVTAGRTVLNLPVPTGAYTEITVRKFAGDDDPSPETFTFPSSEFSWDLERAHGKKFYAPWTYVLSTPDAVEVAYTGGEGSLGTAFKSYRYKGDAGSPSVEEPVAYHLEYSEDGVNWSTTAPSWLTDAISETGFAGSIEGEELTLTLEARTESGYDEHADTLSRRSRGTEKDPFDLSTVNVATGATVARTTANCYVVSASGYYKFPLVYGNALLNGAANDAAYHRQQTTATGSQYLAYLLDHNDEPIDNSGSLVTSGSVQYVNSIYIAERFADRTLTAALVWQDAPGLVTDVALPTPLNLADACMTFHVPAETICQGNAILAVLVDGVVAWSWHIWVTDEDLSVLTEVGDGYRMPQVNLGWCDGIPHIYDAREFQVRAVQTGGETSAPVTVIQTKGKIYVPGNCTYYQWGRKDPLLPATGTANTNKRYYCTVSDYAPQFGVTGGVTLGEAIRNPWKHYARRTGEGTYEDWCVNTYFNNWNTTLAGYGNGQLATPVAKTIYDPSPVGFKVPPQSAVSVFNMDNFTYELKDGNYGRFYRSASNSLFFPGAGLRRYDTGKLGDVNERGYAWYAVPESESYSYHLFYSKSTLENPSDNSRAYAMPVRPVLDN